jgi:hypothetical protein
VGKSLLTVRRWRRPYVAKGVDGLLKDATRRSHVKPLTPEKIRQVVDMTLYAKPPIATQWSARSSAAAAAVSLRQCSADMACPQAQAALDQDFQGLAR